LRLAARRPISQFCGPEGWLQGVPVAAPIGGRSSWPSPVIDRRHERLVSPVAVGTAGRSRESETSARIQRSEPLRAVSSQRQPDTAACITTARG